MVTFARDMTNLEDNQVLSINHQLMRESQDVNLVNEDQQWDDAIQQAINDFNSGQLEVSRTSSNPLARLESARTESPDSARIYAGRRLLHACQEAERAQERYLERFARDTGVSYDSAKQRFQAEFMLASEHASLQAPPRFITAFTNNPDNTGISRDRRTMYALQLLETTRLAQLQATREPAATNSIELNISGEENALAEIRWNSETRHIEADYIDPHDGIRTELYRGDSGTITTLDRMIATDSEDDIINYLSNRTVNSLRENPDYHYSSNQEANRHRWQHRCLTCGQFANSAHYCPVAGSPSSIEADIAYLAGLQINGSGEIQTPHSTASSHTSRYLLDDGSIRLPSLETIRANAREHDMTEIEITAEVDELSQQRGTVQIFYNGYGNGYTAELAVGSGDQGDRRLRCSCPEYADRFTCHHVEILQRNLNDFINSTAAPSRAEIQQVTSEALEEIAQDRQASESSAQTEAGAWREPPEPLVDNFETFQATYADVRSKRQAWLTDPANAEFPLSYQRENAFEGLSTRENGRGFGIEIEFAFPQDMSSADAHLARREIARELEDLGLVSGSNIGHYGASHGWVRNTHARGWSIEEDFSAGGRDGQVPGEIVSPIMYDEPETWENIEKICNIIKRHGGFASRGAGQHVHVGTGDYNHRVVNHNRLLSLVAENEDLLYRLSVNPERGRHRGFGYCSPNVAASEPYSRITHARNSQSGHNLGVNFQSVSGRSSDHAEFRMFDSSLEPAVIQAQIGVSLAMVAAAKRDVISNVPADNHMPLGSRLEANPRRAALSGEEWREQTLPVRSFIDKYVPTQGKALQSSSLAQQVIGLFALTKWQRR